MIRFKSVNTPTVMKISNHILNFSYLVTSLSAENVSINKRFVSGNQYTNKQIFGEHSALIAILGSKETSTCSPVINWKPIHNY